MLRKSLSVVERAVQFVTPPSRCLLVFHRRGPAQPGQAHRPKARDASRCPAARVGRVSTALPAAVIESLRPLPVGYQGLFARLLAVTEPDLRVRAV